MKPKTEIPQKAVIAEIVRKVALQNGDLSMLSLADRQLYYEAMCDRLNLDPIILPFNLIEQKTKSGHVKIFLHVNRRAADVLACRNNLSVKITEVTVNAGFARVFVQVLHPGGRFIDEVGSVEIGLLKENDALKKALTQARRRGILAWCGFSDDEPPDRSVETEYDPPPLDQALAASKDEVETAVIQRLKQIRTWTGLTVEDSRAIADDQGLEIAEAKRWRAVEVLAFRDAAFLWYAEQRGVPLKESRPILSEIVALGDSDKLVFEKFSKKIDTDLLGQILDTIQDEPALKRLGQIRGWAGLTPGEVKNIAGKLDLDLSAAGLWGEDEITLFRGESFIAWAEKQGFVHEEVKELLESVVKDNDDDDKIFMSFSTVVILRRIAQIRECSELGADRVAAIAQKIGLELGSIGSWKEDEIRSFREHAFLEWAVNHGLPFEEAKPLLETSEGENDVEVFRAFSEAVLEFLSMKEVLEPESVTP